MIPIGFLPAYPQVASLPILLLSRRAQESALELTWNAPGFRPLFELSYREEHALARPQEDHSWQAFSKICQNLRNLNSVRRQSSSCSHHCPCIGIGYGKGSVLCFFFSLGPSQIGSVCLIDICFRLNYFRVESNRFDHGCSELFRLARTQRKASRHHLSRAKPWMVPDFS